MPDQQATEDAAVQNGRRPLRIAMYDDDNAIGGLSFPTAPRPSSSSRCISLLYQFCDGLRNVPVTPILMYPSGWPTYTVLFHIIVVPRLVLVDRYLLYVPSQYRSRCGQRAKTSKYVAPRRPRPAASSEKLHPRPALFPPR